MNAPQFPKSILALALIVVLNVQACKYEEGPKISFKSATNRLTNDGGNWTLVSGEYLDIFQNQAEVVMEFEEDGDFHWQVRYESGTIMLGDTLDGQWSWGDKKESIIVNIDGDETHYEVLKLKSDEMKLEDDYYGYGWEFEKQ